MVSGDIDDAGSRSGPHGVYPFGYGNVPSAKVVILFGLTLAVELMIVGAALTVEGHYFIKSRLGRRLAV